MHGFMNSVTSALDDVLNSQLGEFHILEALTETAVLDLTHESSATI